VAGAAGKNGEHETLARNAHRMRAQPRRDLWAVAEAVPAGNTLVLEDLFPPAKATKPEPFGKQAGRKALRIDTTPNADVRERFVREVLERLGAKAQPRVIAILADAAADLGAIQNDLEKLALSGSTITVADLEREIFRDEPSQDHPTAMKSPPIEPVVPLADPGAAVAEPPKADAASVSSPRVSHRLSFLPPICVTA